MSLNESDKLRLFNFPAPVHRIVENAIRVNFAPIQQAMDICGAWEIKIGGNPWRGQMFEAVPSRRMMTAILRDLKSNGWVLVSSTNVSAKVGSKDMLIFQFKPYLEPVQMMAITLNESDKLRLIDYPPGMENALQNVIQRTWGDVVVGRIKEQGCYQFQMSGKPWKAWGSEAFKSRVLVMEILRELDFMGWHLYASIDMSSGHPEHGIGDKDSWFLEYKPTC
jgi:hypothetical protein